MSSKFPQTAALSSRGAGEITTTTLYANGGFARRRSGRCCRALVGPWASRIKFGGTWDSALSQIGRGKIARKGKLAKRIGARMSTSILPSRDCTAATLQRMGGSQRAISRPKPPPGGNGLWGATWSGLAGGPREVHFVGWCNSRTKCKLSAFPALFWRGRLESTLNRRHGN